MSNQILKMIFRFFFILMVCTILGFALIGCSIYHTYRIHPMEQISYNNSHVRIEIFNIEYEIQKSKDTSIFTDPRYFQTAEKMYGRYRNFISDKKKSYWSLQISYISSNKNAFLLIVDSISIIYDSTNSSTCIDCFDELLTVKAPYSPPPYIWYTLIEPIGIPKNHKKDVQIKFILKIFDVAAGSVLTEIPINVLLDRKMRIYTPLWPGV
ncbi:MAG: hypothetical protein GY865_07995 [candidate division Zixibacteria bacterium]|nr:hypothetical protein [candidate division Zixibacteria bacterium]